MNFYTVTVLSFSIFIPGIIGVFSFKRIQSSYYPFLFALWLGCLNEILSFLLIMNHQHNTVNNNIFVLFEAILLSWYFKEAGTLRKNNLVFVITLLLLIWVAENLVFKTIDVNSSYFRIAASLLIVVLSIHLINHELGRYQPGILKNADFLLCCCFIIYFTYKALIQSFIIYGQTRDFRFLQKIYSILVYVNLGINLLYSIAVLCMPRKLKFILPLS
jgi:hypothetical protein